MTQTHPINPPPEVVDRLFMINGSEEDRIIATYRAGADMELEACVKWIEDCGYHPSVPEDLRAARRPKPPSLKEQALEALGPEPRPETGPTGDTILNHGVIERHRLVRRALEGDVK